NLGKEYVTAFGAIYPALAAQYDVLLYPFFLEGAALNAELMQRDGIHPNAGGVGVIVDNILPHVETLLAASQTKEDG
ncbi:MAG: arylesterase, partial [Methyloceanibacter sp.]